MSGRIIVNKDERIEQIKKLLRTDPSLTVAELKARFGGRKHLIMEARKQLKAEGFELPYGPSHKSYR